MSKPLPHVHIENVSDIGPLFEITPAMIAEGEARKPSVKGRWRATYGTDLVGFEAHVSGADAILGWQFRHTEIARLGPKLTWIQLTGAGVDHLLPFDWLPERIALTNAKGAHKPKIGEVLFGGILMLNNNVPALMGHQRERRWHQIFSTGIAGKTLLIVGLGEAGGSLAELAKRFGMRVLATARRTTSDQHVDEIYPPDALDRLLPQADFVVLSVPATPATRGLFGTKQFQAMKHGAGMVNLCRQGIVDDRALEAALRSGSLSGCVYDLEDPSHRPFSPDMWSWPNLLLLPHSQSNDPARYMANTLDIFFENLERWLDGKPLNNVVDPALGY
jgi:glyoxylate/hydroxypyruvate reductase A